MNNLFNKLRNIAKQCLRKATVVVAVALVLAPLVPVPVLAQNAAVFPGAAATQGTLPLAANRAVTTLSANVAPTDTSINVVATTLFPGSLSTTNSTIISVDAEYIKICGSTTTTFTVCSGGRGFDNSSATSHNSNATVSGFMQAYNLNQTTAEVIAVESTLLGGTGVSNLGFRDSTTSPLWQWYFNDTVQHVGLFSQFGNSSGPYINGANEDLGANSGPGVGEYHFYYHDAGTDASVGALGKSFAIQSYLTNGNGGTLVGLWASANAIGSWTPQAAVGGVTNGPIGVNAAAGSTVGGYVAGELINSTCATTACSQLSGLEIDVQNVITGTGGHVGVLVVDQSTTLTNQGSDYGYGISGSSGEGFKYGVEMNTQGVWTGGTLIHGTGFTVANGIDWSGMTFTGNILDLPGFVLSSGGVITSPLTLTSPSATASDVAISDGTRTSGSMLALAQNATTWNGNGLSMNFALTSGSFGGNFEAFFVNSAEKWIVDSTGTPTSPVLASSSGTRYVCVDTAGKFHSSASACSGT